jgi:hypothetical protein
MARKKQEPQSLQKRLWRLGYARSSFGNVRNTCDYILQTPISGESPIYYPLVAAICTLYARPFSRSNIIGRWTKQVVPKKHLDLHELMILMRNQLIAHSDLETLVSVDDMSGNNVRVSRRADSLGIANFQVKLERAAIVRIRDLTNGLVSRIDAQLESLWNERKREFPDIVGEYLVDPKLDRFAPALPKAARERSQSPT